MKAHFSRRDFLRAAGLFPVGLGLAPLFSGVRALAQPGGTPQNVLLLVFDAFSANHIPFLGYARKTTPSLQRLAERAIVYHNHYAGGNFTTPGTASLLTGALPWTHRAFNLNGEVAAAYADKSLFSVFPDHFRIAYSHNPIANVLLQQFSSQIDEYVPWSRLMLTADTFIDSTFRLDQDIAGVGWIRAAKRELEGYSYSLFFSHLYQWYMHNKVAAVAPNFPRGIPEIKGDNYYLLSDAMDWLEQKVGQLAEPYFGYLHFMPPHAPYAAEKVFYRHFSDDKFIPPPKPENMFTPHLTPSELHRKRAEYDEFILNVDRELTRLVDALEAAGRLENTWLVITSDHGELFERGFKGHGSPLLYEGSIRIPLLIFEPGRTNRLDIHQPTSAVDILPTLAHLGGGKAPDWSDGALLPPFTASPADPERDIFVVQARETNHMEAMENATVSLTRGRHKLIYYVGYPELSGEERVELYDLESDPEELEDVSALRRDVAGDLLQAIKLGMRDADEPYA
jgi:arylsulfatase A-like enzyme